MYRWAAFFLGVVAGFGQTGFPRPPDRANVRYGPHERNVLDLWQAKSSRPTPLVVSIHGGGFRSGDKSVLSPLLLDLCLESGISVAAINYRFTSQAAYPAPMLDGARAIQFLRLHAREWNLDRNAFAATGGSAGAGLSLWVGFHDDLANSASDDPVLRESSRLSAVGVFGAQTTYDPRVVTSLIGESAARHGLFEPLYGLHGEEMITERAFRLFAEASPVTHLSAGDPPVLLIYNEPDTPVPAGAKAGAGIHHPRFGFYLKERMDRLGIECTVRVLEEPAAAPTVQRLLAAFFAAHLKGAR